MIDIMIENAEGEHVKFDISPKRRFLKSVCASQF